MGSWQERRCSPTPLLDGLSYFFGDFSNGRAREILRYAQDDGESERRSILTSPSPRRGRREPKVSDGRGATLAGPTALIYLLQRARTVVRLPGGRPALSNSWLDESRLVRCLALHLSRRHRCAAFADLSSDKERLGSAV
jgi:hypothetical protein